MSTQTVKRAASYAAYTPKGRAHGYSGSYSDFFVGEYGGDKYTGYLKFRLSDIKRISAVSLRLYRKDEYSGMNAVLSALPETEHRSTVFEGRNRLTAPISEGVGWKTLPITGGLLNAILACSGKFVLYVNGPYWVNAAGGTDGSKSPHLRVTYSPNEPSAVETDADSYDVGSTVSVLLTPAEEGNRHALRWTVDGESGEISSGVETEAEFQVPQSWLTRFLSDRAQTECVITADTTDADGAFVGSASKTVRIAVPGQLAPQLPLSDFGVSEGSAAVAAITGDFIAGYSKFDLEGTFTAAEGMSVVRGNYAAGGISGTFVPGDGEFFAETAVLRESGEMTVSASVTDSRGLTGTVSKTVTVLGHTIPALAEFTVERCDADGTRNPGSGTYGRVSVTVRAQETGANCAGAKIEYFADGAWQTTYNGFGTSSVMTVSRVFGEVPLGTAVPVRVFVYDSLMTAVGAVLSAEKQVPKGVITLHISPNGKGIGAGGLAESNGFHMHMPLYLHDNVISTANGGTGVQSVAALKALLGIEEPVLLNAEPVSGATSGGGFVEGASVTVPITGVYAVMCGATFAENASGRRALRITLNGTEVGASRVNGGAVSGSVTKMTTGWIVAAEEGDTIAASTWHNAGTLTTETQLTAWGTAWNDPQRRSSIAAQ